MTCLPISPTLDFPYGRLSTNGVLLARTTISTLVEPRTLLLFTSVQISAGCSVVVVKSPVVLLSDYPWA